MPSKKEPAERLVLDWSVADVKDLVDQVQAKVPRRDTLSFVKRVSRLDWKSIVVGSYSSEECRAQWDKIVSNVRTFRILGEVVQDVKTWVDNPDSRPKEKDHPDFPKAPLGAYMKFTHDHYSKLKARYPDATMVDINKKLKKKYDKLSEEDKAERNAVFQAENQKFMRRKEKFYEAHPEYRPLSRKRKRTDGGPPLPKTPFDHYIEGRISADEPEATRKEEKEKLKQKWTDMSDKRKAKYIEMSLADEKRYQEQLTEFKSTHPDFVTSKKHKSPVTKSERQALGVSYGRPKPPPGNSGYTLFCHEFQQSDTANTNDKERWMARASAAWKILTKDAQLEYAARYKSAMEEYREACEAYLAGLPEEKRDEERKILKCEPSSNGRKKRSNGGASSDDAQNQPTKRRTKAAAGGDQTPSGRTVFMVDSLNDYKAKFPTLDDAKLKSLMLQAYDKLGEEKRKVFETRAEQFALFKV